MENGCLCVGGLEDAAETLKLWSFLQRPVCWEGKGSARGLKSPQWKPEELETNHQRTW